MTTPFNITSPGEYRRADGKKQVIAAVQESLAIGFNGVTVAWWATSDGRNCGNGAGGWSDPDADLVAPWTDAPSLAQPAPFAVGDRVRLKADSEHHTLKPGYEFTVTEVDSDGDTWDGDYCLVKEWVEPIPEPSPFRIDRVGVYRQRDGGVARVESHQGGGYPWKGVDSRGRSQSWRPNGDRYTLLNSEPTDLVRYIGPLDEPEPEKPRYKHDCDKCVFLGSHTDHRTAYDLYYCSRFEHSQLVAKEGDEHWEELRGDAGATIPILIEAERRARERGLLKEPAPSPEATFGLADAVEIDATELKQLAREILLRSITAADNGDSTTWLDAADCFDIAAEFSTEAARREKEHT